MRMNIDSPMAKEIKKNSSTTFAKNRKAYHDFSIDEKIEAGMVLLGTEIKSIRAGKLNLKDSFVTITKNYEAFLINCHISPYSHGNLNNHAPHRKRKLLLHKKQIVHLAREINEKGLTVVPLSVYLSKGRAKVKIGVAKGKKLHDKRHSLREKQTKRELSRVLRGKI